MQFLRNLQFLIKRNKKLIGKDILGNSYYITIANGIEKRWVIYNGKADPTKIPALWHMWLHYTDNQVPKSPKNLHFPNLTGTRYAYHPNKILCSYSTR
ncbi:NADH-ubiquinone oxidoreductase subunit NDUFA12 family protein [Ehrlichia muris]|uniref:NADH-ubiquinone oxidoreductase subunit NDUFA12 family protein n=1 Tax=Ehrlichia muris TaxID=35795 RepID=UPI0037C03FC8